MHSREGDKVGKSGRKPFIGTAKTVDCTVTPVTRKLPKLSLQNVILLVLTVIINSANLHV
jgi:hypothetical protein